MTAADDPVGTVRVDALHQFVYVKAAAGLWVHIGTGHSYPTSRFHDYDSTVVGVVPYTHAARHQAKDCA